ncbi:MAG: galactokinase [Treponema sp.]|jgi:galactokinase|nr:galactokinase [Treponema sp.]
MTKKELQDAGAAVLFESLYGEEGVEGARRRYGALLEGMADVEGGGGAGGFRFFTAAGRTELGGNHTDHNRGKVLAASIQLDQAAVAVPRDDGIVFFRSTGFPDVKVRLSGPGGSPDLSPKEEEKGTTEALVRGIAAEFTVRGTAVGGFSANADSTVLPGSGLSSSAAVEVLLGRIFDNLYGGGKRGALEIAQIGQKAENRYFGKPCGLMDQTACASGGAVAIDFGDADHPAVTRINFDPAAAGYAVCVVDTRGSHADLTPDYAAIPEEMKGAAAFFGKDTLSELDRGTVLSRAAELRRACGDRSLLRALHFFDENRRVDAMTAALKKMDTAEENALRQAGHSAGQQAFYDYLDLVNESGDSSWELLQNVYSPQNPAAQGLGVALALSRDHFRKQGLRGACRVHGGGFAGTIQAYMPLDTLDAYRRKMEDVFGEGSVTALRIRSLGAVELTW